MEICRSRKTKRGVCAQWVSMRSERGLCFYHEKVERGLISITPYPEDGINDFKGLN